MSKPNHVLVMLMIAFFESEKQKWKPLWVQALDEYDVCRHKFNTEQGHHYYFDINRSQKAWSDVDKEVVKLDETLDALRAILKS
jgi:hypothetical protein